MTTRRLNLRNFSPNPALDVALKQGVLKFDLNVAESVLITVRCDLNTWSIQKVKHDQHNLFPSKSGTLHGNELRDPQNNVVMTLGWSDCAGSHEGDDAFQVSLEAAQNTKKYKSCTAAVAYEEP